ncbi:MAG: hypothetical protein ABIP54_05175 [Candidatus Andersenbacteria bacterium]
MNLTEDQKKKTIIVLVILVVIIIAALLIRSFGSLLGARVRDVPAVGENIIGGQLQSSSLHTGTNTLQFSGTTRDGRHTTTSVSFDVQANNPYGPYDPYNPTPPDTDPTSDPTQDPYGPY